MFSDLLGEEGSLAKGKWFYLILTGLALAGMFLSQLEDQLPQATLKPKLFVSCSLQTGFPVPALHK